MQKPDLVKIVIRGALKRTWKKMAKERIVNTQPKIPQGKNFWPRATSEACHFLQDESPCLEFKGMNS
jgi:hypothetical protein